MTDKTDSKEREALVAYLKDCDAHDIVPDVGGAWHAAFQAGRASLAASAGSEPVAYAIFAENGQIRLWPVEAQHVKRIAAEKGLELVKLYPHPSPPEGMVGGWIALPGTLPEPSTPVLLDIGKKYPIRAMWAAKFTLLVSLEDDSGFGEHDERTDEWYCPEGWYEWNEHEDTNWAVSATPRAWAPLPPTTSAGSGKGE